MDKCITVSLPKDDLIKIGLRSWLQNYSADERVDDVD